MEAAAGAERILLTKGDAAKTAKRMPIRSDLGMSMIDVQLWIGWKASVGFEQVISALVPEFLSCVW